MSMTRVRGRTIWGKKEWRYESVHDFESMHETAFYHNFHGANDLTKRFANYFWRQIQCM